MNEAKARRIFAEETKQMKLALNRYKFDDMSTRELYAFAKNLPADLEANERTALINELADRMDFWQNAVLM